MGSDWSWRDDDGIPRKPRWLVIILCIAIIVVAIVKCTPTESARYVPVLQPKQTLSSPVQLPSVLPSRPERKPETPTSTSLTMYVVSTVDDKFWGVSSTLAGWKKAKYTDFKLASVCPVAAPCIKISNYNLANDVAAEAEFGYRYQDLYIHVNPTVTTHNEAQSALAHEFGHILGAPHIIGTHNTVMNSIGVYRLLPTKLDVATVDRLGRWQLEKMYANAKKTVDVRALPN